MLEDTSSTLGIHPNVLLPTNTEPSHTNKQAHFDALRKFIQSLNGSVTVGDDLTVSNLTDRLDVLEGNSLYWAPEIFQFKLMPFVRNLTVILNEKFEGDSAVTSSWTRFLEDWAVANTSNGWPLSAAEGNTSLGDSKSAGEDRLSAEGTEACCAEKAYRSEKTNLL